MRKRQLNFKDILELGKNGFIDTHCLTLNETAGLFLSQVCLFHHTAHSPITLSTSVFLKAPFFSSAAYKNLVLGPLPCWQCIPPHSNFQTCFCCLPADRSDKEEPSFSTKSMESNDFSPLEWMELNCTLSLWCNFAHFQSSTSCAHQGYSVDIFVLSHIILLFLTLM